MSHVYLWFNPSRCSINAKNLFIDTCLPPTIRTGGEKAFCPMGNCDTTLYNILLVPFMNTTCPRVYARDFQGLGFIHELELFTECCLYTPLRLLTIWTAVSTSEDADEGHITPLGYSGFINIRALVFAGISNVTSGTRKTR